MKPYQERVVAEKAELDDKIEKLQKFMNDAAFNAVEFQEQRRMKMQLSAMQLYSTILETRIESFK